MSPFKSILPKDPTRQKQTEEGSSGQRSSAQRSSFSRQERSARPGARLSRSRQDHSRPSRRTEEASAQAPSRRMVQRKRGGYNRASLLVFGLIGLLLLILIPTAVSLAKANKQLADSVALQKSLSQQKEKLQNSVNDLKSQLDIVNTDEFISKYAHEKLGMVKPNEIIIRTEDGNIQLNKEALAALESKEKGLAPGAQGSESGESESSETSQAGEEASPAVPEAPPETNPETEMPVEGRPADDGE